MTAPSPHVARLTDDELEALREQSIREIVAAAPPLTGEVREQVRAILNPKRPPIALDDMTKGAAPTAAPLDPARRPSRRVAAEPT